MLIVVPKLLLLFMLNAGKGLVHGGVRPSPSDFDAACSQARVDVALSENPLESGSPPVRSVRKLKTHYYSV